MALSPRLSIIRALLVPALLAGTLAGCGLWPWGHQQKNPQPPATPPAVSDPLTNGGVPQHIVSENPSLKMRIYQLTLPLGAFTLNDKIWHQLDEDALDSETSVLLAQNGLRAAVGPQARWPVIAKMLEGPGTTTQQYLCQTDGRSSIQLATRPNIPEQTLFYVDRDREIEGRTFDRCDNIIRLSMSRLPDASAMLVQLEPVVLTGTIEVARGTQELGVVRMSIPQEETFKNLRLAAPVASQNFLVMATAPKANPFSVGTRFLSDSDKVPPVETVLVFVPLSK